MGADTSAAEFWKAFRQAVIDEVQELRGRTPTLKDQQAFADRTGLTGAAVSRLLKGTGVPTTLTLSRLARAFDEDYFDFVERIRYRIKGPRGKDRPKRLRLDVELTFDEFLRVTEVLATRRKQ